MLLLLLLLLLGEEAFDEAAEDLDVVDDLLCVALVLVDLGTTDAELELLFVRFECRLLLLVAFERVSPPAPALLAALLLGIAFRRRLSLVVRCMAVEFVFVLVLVFDDVDDELLL